MGIGHVMVAAGLTLLAYDGARLGRWRRDLLHAMNMLTPEPPHPGLVPFFIGLTLLITGASVMAS